MNEHTNPLLYTTWHKPVCNMQGVLRQRDTLLGMMLASKQKSDINKQCIDIHKKLLSKKSVGELEQYCS